MAVGFLCFFLAVLMVILQCMIVAFPGHTHFFIVFYTVKVLDGPLCVEIEHGLNFSNDIYLNPCFICIVCISIALINLAGKHLFLLLKSLTLKHTLAKQ